MDVAGCALLPARWEDAVDRALGGPAEGDVVFSPDRAIGSAAPTGTERVPGMWAGVVASSAFLGASDAAPALRAVPPDDSEGEWGGVSRVAGSGPVNDDDAEEVPRRRGRAGTSRLCDEVRLSMGGARAVEPVAALSVEGGPMPRPPGPAPIRFADSPSVVCIPCSVKCEPARSSRGGGRIKGVASVCEAAT